MFLVLDRRAAHEGIQRHAISPKAGDGVAVEARRVVGRSFAVVVVVVQDVHALGIAEAVLVALAGVAVPALAVALHARDVEHEGVLLGHARANQSRREHVVHHVREAGFVDAEGVDHLVVAGEGAAFHEGGEDRVPRFGAVGDAVAKGRTVRVVDGSEDVLGQLAPGAGEAEEGVGLLVLDAGVVVVD